MAFEPKDLTGTLFRNDKGDNPKRPDYRGDCKIGGRVLKISAWIKDKADGGKFMSLAFEDKAVVPAVPPPTGSDAAGTSGLADLPF